MSTTSRPRRGRRTKKPTPEPGRLSGIEEVDAIILSYAQPSVLSTLMRKHPDHPLLTSNSRMWYHRLVMLLDGEWAPMPPYQLDREGLPPTDYRSLWYALTAPSYLDYITMTSFMANDETVGGEYVRQYGDETSPYKNALDAALDTTAIYTYVASQPYRWSEAIIAILTEHIVQFVRGCEETKDTIAVPDGGQLPHWIMISSASRGCIQLITRLAKRLGTLEDDLATMAMTVGRWVFDAVRYAPQLYIMGTAYPTLPTTILPTLTIDTISVLWEAYVGKDLSTVRKAVDNADWDEVNVLRDIDIATVVSFSIRNARILDATLRLVNTLDLSTDVELNIDALLSDILTDSDRDVDDYSAIDAIMRWYIKLDDISSIKGDFVRDLAPEIPLYYSMRIKTRGQSRRFLEYVGTDDVTNLGLRTARDCDKVFNGDRDIVYKRISEATNRDHDDDLISTAILYVRIYLAGRIAHDRNEHTIGLQQSTEMMQSKEVDKLVGLALRSVRRNSGDVQLHALGLLITAARSLPFMQMVYSSQFAPGARNEATSEVYDNPDRWPELLDSLSRIDNALVEIARDPDTDEEAFNWLLDRLAPIIPHTMDMWSTMVDDHILFPRHGMWTNFVTRAIQIPNPVHVPYVGARYKRLLSLIDFAVVPSNDDDLPQTSTDGAIPLPSLDLRRGRDGGLPSVVVSAVARVMGWSHVGSIAVSSTYDPTAYAWDDVAYDVMRRVMRAK